MAVRGAQSSAASDESAAAWILQYLRARCAAVPLQESTRLAELESDSLDQLEMLFELECHFGRTVSNVELASLATVADLIRLFDSSAASD